MQSLYNFHHRESQLVSCKNRSFSGLKPQFSCAYSANKPLCWGNFSGRRQIWWSRVGQPNFQIFDWCSFKTLENELLRTYDFVIKLPCPLSYLTVNWWFLAKRFFLHLFQLIMMKYHGPFILVLMFCLFDGGKLLYDSGNVWCYDSVV